MTDTARPLALHLLRWGAVAIALLVCARTAWRLQESAARVRVSKPLQRAPAQSVMRLLIVGDSTASGTGATAPQGSVAGLLGLRFPRLLTDNRSREGATHGSVLEQLDGYERFDRVLVMAGGNDVVRLRGLQALQGDVERVVQLARQRAGLVVLMPAGNVGNAPFFFAPLSWLMAWPQRLAAAITADR